VTKRSVSWLVAFVLSFLVQCGDSDRTSLFMRCDDPAPLLGEPESEPVSPAYIVGYHEGVDAVAETQRLSAAYGFEPESVFQVSPGFAADLDPVQLAQVRCESTVDHVSHTREIYAY
jgi:hypothetical protein